MRLNRIPMKEYRKISRNMKYEVVHRTEYVFSEKVFYEPHLFRFRPRETPHCHTRHFGIDIDPLPAGITEQEGPEGNHLMMCWFEDLHSELTIEARSVVEVDEFNPYQFLIHPPEFLDFPFNYDSRTGSSLTAALRSMELSGPIRNFLESVRRESNNQSIVFLTELTRQIHMEFVLEAREKGAPHHPDLVFQKKRGSCRDLAWMQIQMLRHMGFAARFVSGYLYLPGNEEESELHAWVEAFLPGAGWIGFDPGHGTAAGSGHIPVAVSSFYDNTMPVTGSVRGSAKSQLKTAVSVVSLDRIQ